MSGPAVVGQWALIFAVLLAGCSGPMGSTGTRSNGEGIPANARDISIVDELDCAANEGYEGAGVLRDAAEFNRQWAQACNGRSPGDAITFGTHDVVYGFLGRAVSGGYPFKVDRLAISGETVFLEATLTVSQCPDEDRPAIMEYPAIFVVVPKTGGTHVQKTFHERQGDCP